MWFGHGDSPPSPGRTMLPDYGGIEIMLPKLQAGVLVAIDELLTTPQRSRLHRWMQAVDAQLDQAAEYLGLTGDA